MYSTLFLLIQFFVRKIFDSADYFKEKEEEAHGKDHHESDKPSQWEKTKYSWICVNGYSSISGLDNSFIVNKAKKFLCLLTFMYID